MRVNIKAVLIHDMSMALQTKAAMLPHSALNAWSDALYYHVKYKSTQVNITFYRCMDKDYETNLIGMVTIWGVSSI